MPDDTIPAPAAPGVAVKPGYKTTEFWMSFITTVLGLLLAGGVIHIPDSGPWAQVVGGLMAAISGGAYSSSRGLTKAAAARDAAPPPQV